MPTWIKSRLEHYINTHTERSADDIAQLIPSDLFSGHKAEFLPTLTPTINDQISMDDLSLFLIHLNPVIRSKIFFVQIKGTHSSDPKDASFKYSLKSLEFPAWILGEVSADPGILFVVVNGDTLGSERIFWKYMSLDFLDGIDANQESCTISFSTEEELFDTEQHLKIYWSSETMQEVVKKSFSREIKPTKSENRKKPSYNKFIP